MSSRRPSRTRAKVRPKNPPERTPHLPLQLVQLTRGTGAQRLKVLQPRTQFPYVRQQGSAASGSWDATAGRITQGILRPTGGQHAQFTGSASSEDAALVIELSVMFIGCLERERRVIPSLL